MSCSERPKLLALDVEDDRVECAEKMVTSIPALQSTNFTYRAIVALPTGDEDKHMTV